MDSRFIIRTNPSIFNLRSWIIINSGWLAVDLLTIAKYNWGYKRGKFMKVIFLQDVSNIAKAGEIKEVANGYGRNFLIPRKLATLAKSDSLNAVSVKLAARARSEAKTEAELLEMANQLEGKEVVLEAKTGGKARLYGSITSADIAAGLEKVTGFAVDKRKIEVAESIRQIGTYEVSVRLTKDLVPKVKVTVTEKSPENA